MSEPRLCQFFLRGRCQREKCEFSHVMPSGSASLATANGSKDQQSNSLKSAAICRFYQHGNCKFGENCRFAHTESSAFVRGKGPYIANKSKASLPDSKDNPDSDDESIMRKGGDSDDDNESVGSGFTTMVFEKPDNPMLPPSSNLSPKERLLSRVPEAKIMSTSNLTVEKVTDNTLNEKDSMAAQDVAKTTELKSQTHADATESDVDIEKHSDTTKEISTFIDTSLSTTTTSENPALARRGNIVSSESGENANGNNPTSQERAGEVVESKDKNSKEIRRDSKTGFEKFEDYFDSDSDNTTLKSQNDMTTINELKDSNDTASYPAQQQQEEKQKLEDQIKKNKAILNQKENNDKSSALAESSQKEDTAAENEEETVQETVNNAVLPTQNKENSDIVEPSTGQQESIDKNESESSDISLTTSRTLLDEENGMAAEPPMPKTNENTEQQKTEVAEHKAPTNVPVRQQSVTDVEKRQQASVKKVIATPADLSKDWDIEDDSISDSQIQSGDSINDSSVELIETDKEKNDIGAAETIENIESFIQDEPKDTSTPAVHATKSHAGKNIASVITKPAMGKLQENKAGDKRRLERTVGGKSKEEWVTMIFGEDGKQIEGSDRKAVISAKSTKKSVYDLNPDGEDFSIDEKTPFTTKVAPKVETVKETPKGRKDTLSKRSGVTKIGNNTYYYTGPKGDNVGDSQDEDATEEEEVGHVNDGEDDEIEDERESGVITGGVEENWTGDDDEDGESSIVTPKKRKVASKSYDSGRKKHNTTYVYGARSTAAKTRRCGECEGCNREDCGKCVTCLDKPKFGGKNSKKQACIYRMCAWKNPSGKRIKPGTAPVAAPPIAPDATTSPAPVRTLAVAAAARERETSVKGNFSKTGVTVKSSIIASQSQDNSSVQQVGGKRGRKSISVISPASVPKRQALDEELPQFDASSFKPGYTPPVVKKGDEEYAIIVSGVKDTGLCGKYWSDLDNLPPRRRYGEMRCTLNDPKPEVVQGPAGASTKTPVKSSDTSLELAGRGRGRPPKTRESRKQTLTPQKMMHDPEEERQVQDENNRTEKGRRGKRKLAAINSTTEVEEEEIDEGLPSKRTIHTVGQSQEANANGTVSPSDKSISNEPDHASTIVAERTRLLEGGEEEQQTEIKSMSSSATTNIDESVQQTEKTQDSLSKIATHLIEKEQTTHTKNGNDTPQASRSVSCVADTNTQREVVVECFAPYDDHRWVNIGKERDGMSPDAVQYARALRPPYHLLSFLRIKGHSTKGMSCTDKNTMVFVVLEGEITVVLHTTQFNAKKGDSFYIPPKNYYNLINQQAREAELSLIQFQYDGPLPTVAAGSQSGMSKPPPSTQGTTTGSTQ